MNPCTPLQPPIQRAAPLLPARPRHAVHYAVSHKAPAAAGHHAATGLPVAHLPLGHHPRRVWQHPHHHAHHVPVHHPSPVPVDSGACGVSDISRKLHASGGGMMAGPLASNIAIGGLTAGGVAVGIGAGAALAQGGSPWSNGGAGGPGFGTPGFGRPGAGEPGFGGPGYGGPGFAGPGGGTGPGGGGPQAPLPGTALVSHAATPPAPVSVSEPSSLLVLAAALLALALTRWTIARR